MPSYANFRNWDLVRENELNEKKGLTKPLTDLEKIELEKEQNRREWITYFRLNPSRFATDYLEIEMLKDWQCWLLHMMFVSSEFLWIASRGLGKTFLIWVYCVVRCILYPGTKIVYTSITLQAAASYMRDKMGELMEYPKIACEVSNIASSDNVGVYFKNGSYIIIRPPSNNALGARANCIVIDEYRRVDHEIIETVFQKFLTAPRHPRFMGMKDENRKPKYKKGIDYDAESNIEIYISSQAPSYEPAYNRYVNAIKDMFKMDRVFAVCLPYYLGMRDEIITKERIIKDLKKEGADKSVFALEYECVPYGSNELAYFTNDMFRKNRSINKIFVPMTPDDFIKNRGEYIKNEFYIPKQNGEKRIIAVDTALTNGSESANTIVICIRLIPIEVKKKRMVDNVYQNYTEKYYEKHIVAIKNINEDLSPDYQAKIIKRYFTHFEANFIAIDTQGTSLGVIYSMVKPTYDAEYNVQYPAYDSINDPKTSEKCKEPIEQRLKVLYNIYVSGASALDVQHQYNTYTRNELLSNHIKFPATVGNGETYLREEHKYDLQNENIQAEWISVYKQCDALIAEAVNLQRKQSNTDTRIILERPKKSTIRTRDRIIALQYGLLFAQGLEVEDFRYEEKFDYKNYKVGAASLKRHFNPFGNTNTRRDFGFGRRR